MYLTQAMFLPNNLYTNTRIYTFTRKYLLVCTIYIVKILSKIKNYTILNCTSYLYFYGFEKIS